MHTVLLRQDTVMQEQLAAFLRFLQEQRNYSENTIAAYRNDLTQFLAFIEHRFPETTGLNDVSSEMVEAYVEDLRKQQYASSSVARKVAATKSFFHHLFAHKSIDKDPTAGVDSPKVEKKLPSALKMEDVDRLLAAPSDKKTPKHLRDTALLALLYATGMRVSELVSLQLQDVDLEQQLLNAPVRSGEERILPFDDATRDILHAYLEDGRPKLSRDDDDEALFLNHRGQQLTRQGLWLIIKAYAKEAKLGSGVTPHTLRHSFAAHKLQAGSDLQEVQHLLGHANISTTQVYTHLDPADGEDTG